MEAMTVLLRALMPLPSLPVVKLGLHVSISSNHEREEACIKP